MAKIINRSSYRIELFGTDSGTACRWILPAGDRATNVYWQTVASFDCHAVRGFDGVNVFDSDGWFQVITTEVHIYDWGDEEVTLHCIPPGSGGAGLRGYKPVPDSFVTLDLDEDLQLAEAAPARADTDDEINANGSLFGTFVRTGRNISVRVRACAGEDVNQSELDNQLAIWKTKIQTTWSGAPSSSGQTLNIECDWVEDCSHYTITVYKQTSRAYMYGWSLTMDDRPNDPGGVDALITSVHEFGHFLGLRDGYIYDGELPWLQDLIDKNPGLKAVAPSAFWPTTLFFAIFSVNKERAADRASRACPAGPPTFDIMQHQNVVRNGRLEPNPHIPPILIDIIEKTSNTGEHQSQPLCWRKELF